MRKNLKNLFAFYIIGINREDTCMISTKGRYAIRVMIDLAEHDNGSYIPLKDIAARQEISKKYLEIIVKDMVAGGLLTGASGKGGGYKLNRTPENYTVGEILELMEGPLAPVACLINDANECPRADSCQTLPIWAEFDKLVHDFFYGKTLKDLYAPAPKKSKKKK